MGSGWVHPNGSTSKCYVSIRVMHRGSFGYMMLLLIFHIINIIIIIPGFHYNQGGRVGRQHTIPLLKEDTVSKENLKTKDAP